MIDIIEKKVNRKQFHYLLSKFLLEKGLTRRFYDTSLRYKLKSIEQGKAYRDLYKKYGFSNNDTFSEHLYKCIDIYTLESASTGRKYIDCFYSGCVSGFFRLVPATFDEDYILFWKKIGDEWEKIMKCIKFDYGND